MDNMVIFFKKYKKILIPSVAAVLVAVIVLLAVLLSGNRAQVDKALDPNNDNYAHVQIKLTMTMKNLSPDTSSEDGGMDTASDMQSGGDMFMDQNGYYNEFGSFVPDISQPEEPEPDDTTEYKITVKKDGNVYYENGTSGELYFYERGGQNYVLRYDDFYGIKKDNGEWVEVPAGNYSIKRSFDFDLLKQVDRKQLERSGDVFIPKPAYLEELFFTLLSIHENNRSKYVVNSVEVSFDKDRIDRIVASCVYDSAYLITQTYDFTYNKTTIELPQVDRVYGEE